MKKRIVQLTVRNRSGILNQLTDTFAERGISLDHVLCTAVHTEPTVVLGFTAPDAVAHHLCRVLGRLPDVTSVQEIDAEAPTVRSFALVALKREGLDADLLEGFQVIAEEADRVIADCADTPRGLDARLAALEERGLLLRAIATSAAI